MSKLYVVKNDKGQIVLPCLIEETLVGDNGEELHFAILDEDNTNFEVVSSKMLVDDVLTLASHAQIVSKAVALSECGGVLNIGAIFQSEVRYGLYEKSLELLYNHQEGYKVQGKTLITNIQDKGEIVTLKEYNNLKDMYNLVDNSDYQALTFLKDGDTVAFHINPTEEEVMQAYNSNGKAYGHVFEDFDTVRYDKVVGSGEHYRTITELGGLIKMATYEDLVTLDNQIELLETTYSNIAQSNIQREVKEPLLEDIRKARVTLETLWEDSYNLAPTKVQKEWDKMDKLLGALERHFGYYRSIDT